MNEYNLALSDMQSALKESIFDSYKAQAFWKMGVCYKAIGETERSKVAFGVAGKLLQNNEGALSNLKKDMAKDYNHINKQFKKGNTLLLVTANFLDIVFL